MYTVYTSRARINTHTHNTQYTVHVHTYITRTHQSRAHINICSQCNMYTHINTCTIHTQYTHNTHTHIILASARVCVRVRGRACVCTRACLRTCACARTHIHACTYTRTPACERGSLLKTEMWRRK